MTTKEELQQLIQQDNAVEAIYEMLSEQEKRIQTLEEENNGIKAALNKI